MGSFIAGLELAASFYERAVRPIVADEFPRLRHSAARVGSGSEVLGYDTARSADHEWGPRLQLFLNPDDLLAVGERVRVVLSERLPPEFLGWPTNFGPENAVVRRMEPTDGPVQHRVDVVSLAGWTVNRLGFDATAGVTTFDWLATPAQRLAETVGGALFHDGLATLEPLRAQLSWYPSDVWRFLLACQWQRIAEEEAFPGRCAEVGDDLGSRVVTARLVRDLMRLSLLMQRRYPPYGKWLGSAYSESSLGADNEPSLQGALDAPTWAEREASLVLAYRHAAKLHNGLGLTKALDDSTCPFHDRPFQVIDGARFASALLGRLTGTELEALPLAGSVDQFVDSSEVLNDPPRARAATAAVYPELGRSASCL